MNTTRQETMSYQFCHNDVLETKISYWPEFVSSWSNKKFEIQVYRCNTGSCLHYFKLNANLIAYKKFNFIVLHILIKL